MSEQLILEWNSTAHAWWNWMWPMSWQLVILVLVLGLLTWLLRNYSARLRYALWLLVPVRLILPPTLALMTGWGWWILPTDSVMNTQPQKQMVASILKPKSQMKLDAAPVQQPAWNSQAATMRTVGPLAIELPTMEFDSQVSANESKVTMMPEPAKSASIIAWQSWLFLGWGFGVVLLLARLVYGLIQAQALIRRSEIPRSADIVELLEKCRRSMGLRRTVGLRELDGAGVPMLVGIFRPTIILPKDIDGRLTSNELEAVLFHELHHVSRFDAFVNLVQSLLASIYFFHPFVWVANRVLIRLREDACDEATVTVLKGQRSDYG
ncbi:MAG: M56 family metallopeptidase, partial [Gimesia sp.]